MAALLFAQWKAMAVGESDLLVKSSQLAAFIMQTVDDVSWVGFYWKRQQQLVVGSYQGPVACTHIPLNKGVCGHCYTAQQIQIVDNVDLFDGHIACDTHSVSEAVFPLVFKGNCLGVLDIDSYKLARFDVDLVEEIELIVADFMQTTDFGMLFPELSLINAC